MRSLPLCYTEGDVNTDGLCRSIEDNVRKTCEGLVHDAVVIGSGRTAPVLVVESTENGLDVPAQAVLVHTIIERTAEFNKRAFAHERIEDPKRILVVDRGTLPRTKVRCYYTRALRAYPVQC